MGYFGQKPDYNRKKIKERLYKLKLRLGEEYDELNFDDIIEWCDKVKKKTEDISNLKIDIDLTYEDTAGCDSSRDIIFLVPFYNRLENDKEYNERITKEEKQYNERLEIERLEKEKNEEYLKDRAEYERIKKKYHF